MQDIYRQIFEMATKEVPHKHFRWSGEEAVIYRGFRISKKDNQYQWHDARYSNYMEPVDPLITENILKQGFCETITQVMVHTDPERVLQLKRQTEQLDAEVDYWTRESAKAYNKFVRDQKKADATKSRTLKKKYEKEKSRFAKKRGVLKSEREAIQADIDFYESRIKLYNPN